MNTVCVHQSDIREVVPRTPDGCEECLKSGDRWLHLRLCLTCGHVGCCDESPNRHARSHFHATRHPIIESYQSSDRWRWCYIDETNLDVAFRGMEMGREIVPRDSVVRAAPVVDPTRRTGGLLSRLLGTWHSQDYLVGVIDNPGSAVRGAHALEIYGFTAADIVLQPGSEISRRIVQPDFRDLIREATLEEGSICQQYNELARGGAVLSVRAPTPEDVRRACHIMTAYDAHSLMHVGAWTITNIPVEEQCWT